jgi:hypothetical protein
MNARDIIEEARRSGVSLSAQNGEIRYKGPREMVDRLVPELRRHKPELIELLTAVVTVQTATAQCDMVVDRSKVVDFMAEARRRGLIVRYRIEGHDTVSSVMAPPGQTTEQLREQLTTEFGNRVELES